MTCLITGCALNDLTLTRTVWGDLHQIGDCYIFNACLTAGNAAWRDGELAHNSTWVIECKFDYSDDRSFERRGVIIIPKSKCRLNARAADFLEQRGHL